MAHIIDQKLQELSCPVVAFVAIADGLVGRTRLTQLLKGEKSLDQIVVDKLVTLLDEMIDLRDSSLILPDWADADGIIEQLNQRRSLKNAIRYESENVRRLLLREDEL